MPTTASGTPYTVTSIDLGDPHGIMYYGVADEYASEPNRPLIAYAHGDNGAANQFATLPAWQQQRDWSIDNAYAWVEGSGGSALGLRNWGNPAAQAAYPAYIDRVSDILDIGKRILLGRSMGGLVTAYLYAKSGMPFDGWINNSGVSTIFVGSQADADETKRPSWEKFKTGMYPAWGVTNLSGLHAAADYAAPENFAPSDWAGKKILCCYGDLDDIVPFNPRGAGPLRAIWAGQPTVDQLSVRVGGDHSGTNGSYLDTAAMIPFLTSIGGAITPEPPTPTYFKAVNSYILGPYGERFPFSPKPLEVPA